MLFSSLPLCLLLCSTSYSICILTLNSLSAAKVALFVGGEKNVRYKEVTGEAEVTCIKQNKNLVGDNGLDKRAYGTALSLKMKARLCVIASRIPLAMGELTQPTLHIFA